MAGELEGHPAYLDADVPIDAASAERLGRLGFVRLLARRVLSYSGERALVIGVCGPWGSGKTSIVNLVMNEIRASRAAAGRTVLDPVSFTPWALGTRDDLAQDLLRQVGGMVKDGAGGGAVGAEIGMLIAEVGTALTVAGGAYAAGAPDWLMDALSALGVGGRIKDGLARGLRKQTAPSLREASDRVAKKLRSSNALLVVALDDLERLPSDQVHAVFRVVNALANFPNTVYILCMDRHRVAEALHEDYGDGHAYLEKFLSLTFDVPPPDRDLLGALFVEKLNAILSARHIDTDEKRFAEVWHAGLGRVVQTPRDIVRVLNSYDMALDAISTETDAIDLLALEAFRVLEPSVHRGLTRHPFGVLRRSRDFLFNSGLRTDEERNKRADAELATVLAACSTDRKEAVEALIRTLFPATQRGVQLDEHKAHRGMRAASVDHFENYFRWSLASGALSEVELFRVVDALVLAVRDSDLDMWYHLNSPRFAHLGEKLFHYLPEIQEKERRFDVAAGLLRVGHALDDRNWLVRSNFTTAITLAYHLVRKSPESWDAELWRRCQDSSWLYALTHLLAKQCNSDSRLREPDLPTPTDETRVALSDAISRSLEAGAYDAHPNLALFLHRWSDVSGDAARPRDWVHRKVVGGDPLVWSLLGSVINGAPMVEHFGDYHRETNRNNLEHLYDLDELRRFVVQVPHPLGATHVVAACRRALGLDD